MHFYVYECFAYLCVYASHICLVPKEARRGRQIPWDWSYRRAVIESWELKCGGCLWRRESTLNSWTISPALMALLKCRGCVHTYSKGKPEVQNRVCMRKPVCLKQWTQTQASRILTLFCIGIRWRLLTSSEWASMVATSYKLLCVHLLLPRHWLMKGHTSF